MSNESTPGGSETRKPELSSDDENAIDAAATEYATYADNENNDYSYSQDEHHTFTQGANWGIKYARSVQSSVQSPEDKPLKIGGTNENYGGMLYSTAMFDEAGNCVGRSFATTYEESVSLAKRFAGLKSPSLVNDEAIALLKDAVDALESSCSTNTAAIIKQFLAKMEASKEEL